MEADATTALTGMAAMAGSATLLFCASHALRGRSAFAAYAADVAALVLCWWTTSLSLIAVDRHVLGSASRGLSFPLTFTIAGALIKGLIAFFPATASHATIPLPPTAKQRRCGWWDSRWQYLKLTQRLSRSTWLYYLLPLGITTGLDVWLGKVALGHVEVNVYTVTRAAGIVFTYGLSVLLRLQKLRGALVATVIAILAGVVMSTLRTDEGEPGHGDHGGGQKALSALGVAAAIGASACSALRWVLTERYLARRKVTHSVFAVMTLQAPITAAMLLPVWGYMEASAIIGGAAERALRDHAILVGMCVGGGALSFVLVMLELQLVRQTSALSLNVVGHLKDIVAICMAVLVFHEHISPTNVTGIVFTVAGTMAYSWLKGRTTKAATIAAAPPPGTSAAADTPVGAAPSHTTQGGEGSASEGDEDTPWAATGRDATGEALRSDGAAASGSDSQHLMPARRLLDFLARGSWSPDAAAVAPGSEPPRLSAAAGTAAAAGSAGSSAAARGSGVAEQSIELAPVAGGALPQRLRVSPQRSDSSVSAGFSSGPGRPAAGSAGAPADAAGHDGEVEATEHASLLVHSGSGNKLRSSARAAAGSGSSSRCDGLASSPSSTSTGARGGVAV